MSESKSSEYSREAFESAQEDVDRISKRPSHTWQEAEAKEAELVITELKKANL